MTLFQIIPILVISLFHENGGYIIANIAAYHSDPFLMDEHINTIPDVFNSTVNSLKILTLFSQIGTFLFPSLFIFWRFKNIPLYVNKMDKKTEMRIVKKVQDELKEAEAFKVVYSVNKEK